jgi:hypothetical protein
MSDDVIQQARRGGFARIKLRGGPTISGYAGTDPHNPRFLRLDSFVAEDDGSLSQVSLRLTTGDVETVEVLADAPRFRNRDGTPVVMPASFWPEEAG